MTPAEILDACEHVVTAFVVPDGQRAPPCRACADAAIAEARKREIMGVKARALEALACEVAGYTPEQVRALPDWQRQWLADGYVVQCEAARMGAAQTFWIYDQRQEKRIAGIRFGPPVWSEPQTSGDGAFVTTVSQTVQRLEPGASPSATAPGPHPATSPRATAARAPRPRAPPARAAPDG